MRDEPGQPGAFGKVRASDAERESTVERLREATAEAWLTRDDRDRRAVE